MTTARQAVGAYGERIAEQHLTAPGLVVIARNWRCPDGEVDLILRDGDDVVFCEVKTRRSTRYSTPAEAVVGAKARRLRRLAARWLAGRHPGAPPGGPLRRGVGAAAAAGSARLEHLRGAF